MQYVGWAMFAVVAAIVGHGLWRMIRPRPHQFRAVFESDLIPSEQHCQTIVEAAFCVMLIGLAIGGAIFAL